MVIAKIPDENGRFTMIFRPSISPGAQVLVMRTARWARIMASPPAASSTRWHQGPGHLCAEFRWRGGVGLGPKPVPPKPGEKRSTSAGMAGMFLIMNAARLGLGCRHRLGEVAYQNGMAYVHERRVGRALTGPRSRTSPDLEIVHPDASACCCMPGRPSKHAGAGLLDHAQYGDRSFPAARGGSAHLLADLMTR